MILLNFCNLVQFTKYSKNVTQILKVAELLGSKLFTAKWWSVDDLLQSSFTLTQKSSKVKEQVYIGTNRIRVI